jgi:hypothetical protein
VVEEEEDVMTMITIQMVEEEEEKLLGLQNLVVEAVAVNRLELHLLDGLISM